MDYDENDFQSQNRHLAGEGSNKFPSVLRPYALPKFDFDDSLHASLRFDSLVETEVFLGIESNEDNQWIEEFSQGSSGIQFSSSAAESCTITRRNNVWSEATSSESVEMLLKSVGQEEITPVQTNTTESDACDELGCIMKHMESSLKQDSDTPSKMGDITDLQPTSQPDGISEKFSVSENEGGRQQPQVDDSLQTHKGETSIDGGLDDLTAISVDIGLPVTKGTSSIDGKCNDANRRECDDEVNGSLDNVTQKCSTSGMQVDTVDTPVQNIIVGSDELNNEQASLHINVTSDENVDVLESDNDKNHEEQHVLSQEARMDDQTSDVHLFDSGTSQSENPLFLAPEESVEEAKTIESKLNNVEEPSCRTVTRDSGFSKVLEIGDQSRVKTHEVSLMGIEDNNTSSSRNEVEDSSVSQFDNKNLESKSGASLLSVEDNEASKDNIDGTSNNNAGRSPIVVCSPAELLSATHAEGHVSSFMLAESMQLCEKNMGPGHDDHHKSDQDTPVEEKKSTELLSVSRNMDFEVVGSLVIDRGLGSSSFGEGGTENELIVSKLQSDPAAGHKSVDGVPVPSGDGSTADVVIDHIDTEISSLPATEFTHSHKKEEIADKISIKASFSDLTTFSRVTIGVDSVSESSKSPSSGASGQMLCESADQSLSMVDACNTESQTEPQAAVINKVSQDCPEETRVCPVFSDSNANKGESSELLVKGNDGKESLKVSEPNVNSNEMLVPVPSAKEESWQDTSEKGQKENETIIVSGDASYRQSAIPSTNECESCADLDKPAGGSPTVIRSAELSQKDSDKEGVKGSTDQTVSVGVIAGGDISKVLSVSQDPKENDAPKDSFTFEVSPLADLPEKEAGKKWQPFSNIQASKLLPVVDGSPSTSGLGQLDPKIGQDISRGSPKVSDVASVRSGSKGNPERKARRASGKATGKNSAKKGNYVKETTSVRLERGEKLSNVSLSSSGITQLVQSNEMQRYGHVDSSNIKPFVIATSTSSLPDLNSSASPSAMFQQPFTDLQQVQLRAQIFVYGALIQGTVPDEAYMISSFGGPDGGRNVWENAWRLCIERLHGQKSHLISPETPLPSRSGARASDPAIQQSALQSKAISSPAGRASSKGTPSAIVNPIVPLSSPLWSIPTPSGDTLQSTGMPRGPVVDYQRPLSPLHPHQTPAMRNFVGHNPPWISQAPFCGPWVASPQTAALDTSGRFSVQLPITEPVQLTPVKEFSLPHSSGAKHVSPVPVAQSGASASAFTGTSPLSDAKKVISASGQPSTDPKPRKRKKISVSENPSQDILHPQPQTESVPVPAPAVTSHLSTSVAITTPVGFVSKAPTEKFIASVPPLLSTELRKGDQIAERRAVLSEETLGKLKEARVQAEDATALAAAAVGHSQEIWSQLDKQRNSGLLPDVETKLASAAVAIAAAAAVAKAASAAAHVASNAALQAKLFADEAIGSGVYSNPSQSNLISLSNGIENLGQATPASILKGDDGTNSSSSILVAAREAARRRVEAASAASKQAENMDAIVKAAELAAEAVSQAATIVAMGNPFPLSELVAAGPEGYWKVAHVTSELASKSNNFGREILNIDSVGEGQDTSARHLKDGPSDKRETQITNHGKLPTPREMSSEEHGRLVDGSSGDTGGAGGAASGKDAKGQKGRKASDLAKSENGSRRPITVQNESEKVAETLKENGIKEGSHVEVFKEGSGYKAAWFSANVLSLKDGKAYVSYSELTLGEGAEKLKEWVALNGEGDEAPKVRTARPITAMPFEGTRKRRRAAMGDYTWSVGDRVDAWIQNSWWEGVITEKSKKDETMLTVHFPGQGETSVIRAWHLRPSFVWKDGEWIEWSSSRENGHTSHGGDTPQEKRPRMRSPAVEAKGKEKASKSIDAMEPNKPDEPTLLDLSGDEKLFNIGKSTRDEKKPDTLRMTRTGLQKEGSRVIFGVPKPGKKRKFMEVSKHYVADRSSKTNEANDSGKFAKYLMPQGSGSRGWKSTSKTESHEKRAALSKPKVVKSGKPQIISGRTIPQKDNLLSTTVSAPDDGAVADHTAKAKDSVSYVENTSGKPNLLESQLLSASEGMAEGPILFSSLALPTDTLSSKKISTSNAKPERVSKGKLAPARLGKIDEDKVFNGSSSKPTSDAVEPRRSNRRMQPTSRLLEGLQSSLMVTKIPSVSHDKSQRSRVPLRGNNLS